MDHVSAPDCTARPPGTRRAELRALVRRSHEVVLLAGIVGIATGLGVALFDGAVTRGVDALSRAPLWIVTVAPLAGLTVAAASLHLLGPTMLTRDRRRVLAP